MLSDTTVGTNDLIAVARFYNAILIPRGYAVEPWESSCATRFPASKIRETTRAPFT